MNPILISAAFGLIKGMIAGPRPEGTELDGLHVNVVGPVYEEALYRAMPISLGNFPRGLSALTFAIDHVIGEHRRFGLAGLDLALRFADVFFGGWQYEKAYRTSGFVSACAAHMAHNMCVGLGRRVR